MVASEVNPEEVDKRQLLLTWNRPKFYDKTSAVSQHEYKQCCNCHYNQQDVIDNWN